MILCRGTLWFILAVAFAASGIVLSFVGCAPWYPVCIRWNRDQAHRTSIEIYERTCYHYYRPPQHTYSYTCYSGQVYFTSLTGHTCDHYSEVRSYEGETRHEYTTRVEQHYNPNRYFPVLSPSSGDGPCLFFERPGILSYESQGSARLAHQANAGLAMCCFSFCCYVVWVIWVVKRCEF